MKFFFLILTFLLNIIFVFGQGTTQKKRFNHVFTFGATNSIIINQYKEINDFEGYSKRQIALDYELGYLLSFRASEKVEIKAGLNPYTWVKNYFQYYGYNKIYASGNPTIPILLEIQKLNNSNFFLSIGLKLSYDIYTKFTTHYLGENLSPKVTIEKTSTSGVNPIISLGFGKRKMIKDKYRLEWLLSYNQGTNSLVNYKFVRFDPYIVSSVNSRHSHLSFTLRYYFKKYCQNDY